MSSLFSRKPYDFSVFPNQIWPYRHTRETVSSHCLHVSGSTTSKGRLVPTSTSSAQSNNHFIRKEVTNPRRSNRKLSVEASH
ncbi:unnamed protein product [Penicillium roqueforti FM164]|uniref:Genomic scaffold, ProqFM164S02 n=1 Tax=Penicillium roqueforti (strain FM164) TaxID=1365484 RepID=W6QEN8_PENRF|nr:unnamed protein product [Penicillium roqueforti FM164]